MYFEDEKSTTSFVAGLMIGAVLGAGAALLWAPDSGRRTRRKMLKRVLDSRDQLGDQVEHWADELQTRLRGRRRRRRRA